LEADMMKRALGEEQAMRANRMATVEANAVLSERHAHLDADARGLEHERAVMKETKRQLEEAERSERQLRMDLAAAREQALNQQRETADMRMRLDLLGSELQRTREDLEKAENVAKIALRAESSMEEAEAAARGQALRQQLVARDNEQIQHMKAEAAGQRNIELRKEMAALRSSIKDTTGERQRYETLLREKLTLAWQFEREGLVNQIEALQRAARDDADRIAGLRRELRRQQDDAAAAEEGGLVALDAGRALTGAARAPGGRRRKAGARRPRRQRTREEAGGAPQGQRRPRRASALVPVLSLTTLPLMNAHPPQCTL